MAQLIVEQADLTQMASKEASGRADLTQMAQLIVEQADLTQMASKEASGRADLTQMASKEASGRADLTQMAQLIVEQVPGLILAVPLVALLYHLYILNTLLKVTLKIQVLYLLNKLQLLLILAHPLLSQLLQSNSHQQQQKLFH